VDDHPKFKQLKQVLSTYNNDSQPSRVRYQQTYIEQLFKMLSELTRLETAEEQLDYLEKIHRWATKGGLTN
jgi:hypothetical protein